MTGPGGNLAPSPNFANLWIEFIYVSLATGRPSRHPEGWLELLQAVVIDDSYEADGFNRRVEQTRQQLRERVA